MWDGETPGVCRSTYPRARKQHRCCECRRPVTVGHQYERTKGCWDGEWSTYVTCGWCARVRHALQHGLGWEVPVFGDLWEGVLEVGEVGA